MIQSIIKEFREFAFRGNFIDMALGILIGSGMTLIAHSIISDLVMPLIGFAFGKLDFSSHLLVLKQGQHAGPYATPELARKAGAIVISYGSFLNALFSFLTSAWVAFWIVKVSNRFRPDPGFDSKAKENLTKECSYCVSAIPLKAMRCPFCTSQLS